MPFGLFLQNETRSSAAAAARAAGINLCAMPEGIRQWVPYKSMVPPRFRGEATVQPRDNRITALSLSSLVHRKTHGIKPLSDQNQTPWSYHAN